LTMLQVNDLQRLLRQKPCLAWRRVRFGAGEIVALLGRNGSGRSTTAQGHHGLVQPHGLRCAWQGPAKSLGRQALRDRPVWAWATCPRAATSSQTDGAAKPGCWAASAARRQRRWTFDDMYRLFPALQRASSTPRPVCCPAANSRC
jgi:branched-chain amino acid transport system ATP-binding protein